MTFHEVQRLTAWRWLLLAALLPPAAIAAWSYAAGEDPLPALLSLVAVAAVDLWFLFVARLETTVDREAVRIAFRGVWPTRRIPVEQIATAEARRYGILDSGGWGVHIGRAGWTYNVSGDRGVALVLRDGRRLLIGSQRADELAAAISGVIRARA